MKKKKTFLEEQFDFDKKNVGLFFLGVGITMLILNVITMITSLQTIMNAQLSIDYPFGMFYTSFLTSILLVLYALFNLYDEK